MLICLQEAADKELEQITPFAHGHANGGHDTKMRRLELPDAVSNRCTALNVIQNFAGFI